MNNVVSGKPADSIWLPRHDISSLSRPVPDDLCPYSREQITALIALQHIDELGPVNLSLLLAKAGSIEALIGGAIDPMTVRS